MFKKTCSFKLVSFAKVVCFVVCKCCLQTLQIGFCSSALGVFDVWGWVSTDLGFRVSGGSFGSLACKHEPKVQQNQHEWQDSRSVGNKWPNLSFPLLTFSATYLISTHKYSNTVSIDESLQKEQVHRKKHIWILLTKLTSMPTRVELNFTLPSLCQKNVDSSQGVYY